MQKKWQAFAKKINVTTDFQLVLNEIELILVKPYDTVVKRQPINNLVIGGKDHE